MYSAIVSDAAQPMGLWPWPLAGSFFDCFIELLCFAERAKAFRFGKVQ
jgi:hypothetical protein